MKFFAIFFLVATAICGILWYTDAAGSGMGIATGGFAVLAIGVGLYNKVTNGAWLSDATRR